MRNRRPGGLVLAAVVVLPCGGCTSANHQPSVSKEILNILGQQAAAWNAGDIDSFMDAYWHSPELTFSSGGRVVRGWEATIARYRKRYPTREAMGHLTFADLEVTPLDRNVALVLGRWKLEREDPVGGTFTLVVHRKVDGWVIVHDHTSRDEP